jgi:hypothetical protein
MRLLAGRERFWLGLATSLAVIGVVAGISLGILTLAGVTFQGERAEGQTTEPVVVNNGALITANRDRLAICVRAIGLGEGVEGAVEAEAKSAIETALAQAAAQNPQWADPLIRWNALPDTRRRLTLATSCPPRPKNYNASSMLYPVCSAVGRSRTITANGWTAPTTCSRRYSAKGRLRRPAFWRSSERGRRRAAGGFPSPPITPGACSPGCGAQRGTCEICSDASRATRRRLRRRGLVVYGVTDGVALPG